MRNSETRDPDREARMNQVFGAHKIGQDSYVAASPFKLEARCAVTSSSPVHVVFMSDVYFGSRYCDVEQLRRDLEIVREIPSAFIIFLGNLVSNPIANKTKNTDVISHHQQVEYMSDLVHQLDDEGRVMAAVRSSYDDDRKVASSLNLEDGLSGKEEYGESYEKEQIKKAIEEDEGTAGDVNRKIFKDVSFPVFVNGGVLNVDFGKATYRLALYSKAGPYKSYFHRSHAAKREMQLDAAGKVDLVVVAYQRQAGIMQEFAGYSSCRVPIMLIAAGTYRGNITGDRPQLSDLLLRDRTAREGERSGQSVTLYPKEKRMTPHLELEDLYRDDKVAQLTADLETVADDGEATSQIIKKGLTPEVRDEILPHLSLVKGLFVEEEAIRESNERRIGR